MSFKVVIPARHASARLPGKPLLEIAGRPMIQWVIAAAMNSGADEVLVATDDERIAAAAFDPRNPGQSLAVMTRADHLSGTDRIAEVAAARGWSPQTIVVNVQGDEPQMPPALIAQVAAMLAEREDAHVATLATVIETLEEFMDPNAVKVVTAADGMALYFSRAPIPWGRDSATRGVNSQSAWMGARRHLGIYGYRTGALQSITRLPVSELEMIEKLEQLRALQAGMRILVANAEQPVPGGVDTLEDLQRVRTTLTL